MLFLRLNVQSSLLDTAELISRNSNRIELRYTRHFYLTSVPDIEARSHDSKVILCNLKDYNTHSYSAKLDLNFNKVTLFSWKKLQKSNNNNKNENLISGTYS